MPDRELKDESLPLLIDHWQKETNYNAETRLAILEHICSDNSEQLKVLAEKLNFIEGTILYGLGVLALTFLGFILRYLTGRAASRCPPPKT